MSTTSKARRDARKRAEQSRPMVKTRRAQIREAIQAGERAARLREKAETPTCYARDNGLHVAWNAGYHNEAKRMRGGQ